MPKKAGTPIEEIREYVSGLEFECPDSYQLIIEEIAKGAANSDNVRDDYFDNCNRWVYNWCTKHNESGGMKACLRGIRKIAHYAKFQNKVVPGEWAVVTRVEGDQVFFKTSEDEPVLRFKSREEAKAVAKRYNHLMRTSHSAYRLRLQKRYRHKQKDKVVTRIHTGEFSLYRIMVQIRGTGAHGLSSSS